MLRVIHTGLFLLIIQLLNAQSPDFQVINPLPIKPALSGSFGELRSNHFHAGLDLKTGGKEGMEVMAAASGHVSRIKISPYGYGLALYIDHPEGYTTVYGHLRSFNPEIGAYVKAAQKSAESFEVDVYPGEDELPVEKGQVVAYSGNTGGSGGPHLHFEVRETVTEVPRNPLLFGFPLDDRLRPRIQALAIVPIGEGSSVNGKRYPLRASANRSSINANQPVKVKGAFSVAVNGYDQFSGSLNQNGFYRLKLFADSLLISTFTSDSIPFHDSRFINAQIDYRYYYNQKSRFLRLYRLPGNDLEAARYKREDGVMALNPGKHSIEVWAEDLGGNVEKVSFSVMVSEAGQVQEEKPEQWMEWNTYNYYETTASQVAIPEGALYESIDFSVSERLDSTNDKSATISVHKSDVPLHKPISIRLKTYGVSDSSKAFIAQLNSAGGFRRALASHWNGKWLEAESKYFGKFKVMEDVKAPSITYPGGGSYFRTTASALDFRISDNRSGIYDYDAFVDGQWVVAAYEPKKRRLRVQTEDVPATNAEHELRIYVTDMVGNVATFEGIIYK